MCIYQENDYITLDQNQYVKNIITRFENPFKHKFKVKVKDLPLPTNFVPSKKDCPTVDAQYKEIKLQFGNLHYCSSSGALLYISCCTCPDITYAVKKLVKFANNPGVTHYWALLHLIRFIMGNINKGLKFYHDLNKNCILC